MGCNGLGVVLGPQEEDLHGVILPFTSLAVVDNSNDGSRRLLTGNLGEAAMGSGHVALSWVLLHLDCLRQWLGCEEEEGEPAIMGVHVHADGLAIPKDGASLPCAIAIAAIASLCQIPTPTHTAVTGQVDLRGHVLGVEGLAMKIACAKVGDPEESLSLPPMPCTQDVSVAIIPGIRVHQGTPSSRELGQLAKGHCSLAM